MRRSRSASAVRHLPDERLRLAPVAGALDGQRDQVVIADKV
jgi:hypothetical protein